MQITSLAFLLFFFILFVVYYIIPGKYQWYILLIASLVFYCFCSFGGIIFVLITGLTIYFATKNMQRLSDKQHTYLKENKETLTKEEKKKYKEKIAKQRKYSMICALLVNFGLLCFFKYFHFVLSQISSVSVLFGGGIIEDNFSFIIPLGISFYTFQATGYLLDVYWEYYSAEKNPLKLLLFVSFFPQMTQGPISDFQTLSTELFKEHKLDYNSFSWGFQRMIWGFMKKMVLADILSPWVSNVFENYSYYGGIAVLIGTFMYSVQIYADFSGYMDIMCGLCEMLGIKLTENFERPYFSKSIAEYWRRWHISLGSWFKKYLYYPIGMSSWSRKLGQKSKAKFGKHFGDMLPASIGLTITWLATGLWHGASWAYIAWGGVNGLFIIFSMWMEPVYENGKKLFHIDESKWLWRAFQTIRTFILVTFIKVLPEVGTLGEGIGFWKKALTGFSLPASFSVALPYVDGFIDLAVVLFMVLLLFIVSLLQRKKPFREYFNKLPLFVRIFGLALCFFVIVIFGIGNTASKGFMYEQF